VLTLILFSVLAQAPEAQAALRDQMQAATAKQREAAQRQAAALGLSQARESAPIPLSPSEDFFFTPWPRPEGFTDPGRPAATTPGPEPTAPAPVKTTGIRFDCAPLGVDQMDGLVSEAAGRHAVPPELLRAVIRQESGGYPCAVSPVGAVGLMQLMPQTAEHLRVRDPADPRQSVDGGARYLRELLDRYGGDVERALGAYNAGPGAVDRHGGVPPYAETQGYVTNIMNWLTRRAQ
jgi:hypothetical protein